MAVLFFSCDAEVVVAGGGRQRCGHLLRHLDQKCPLPLTFRHLWIPHNIHCNVNPV